jgi:hypothetical protein
MSAGKKGWLSIFASSRDSNNKIDPEIQEIGERITAATDGCTAEWCYKLGELILQDAADDTSRFESKTTTVTGFAGGSIAILLANAASWTILVHQFPGSGWMLELGMLLLVAAGLTGLAQLLPRQVQWISHKDIWFATAGMNDHDYLVRRYAIAMFRAAKTRRRVNEIKSRLLTTTQVLFVLGAALLTAPVFARIYALQQDRSVAPAAFDFIGDRMFKLPPPAGH